jgi:mono/diheme cytochrome c family protein
MRRLITRAILASTAAAAILGCDGTPPVQPTPATLEQQYLTERDFRREQMMASLAGVEDDYARLRRDHYASGDSLDWDLLPAWNPPVVTLTTADFAAGAVVTAGPPTEWFAALPISDAAASGEAPALRALGQAAFFQFPVQLLPQSVALTTADLARYGLWVDDRRAVGGLVRAQMADGTTRLAYTCATCHSAVDNDGRPLVGLGNDQLDLGALLADAARPGPGAADGPANDSSLALRAWGRGRIDVTTAAGTLPVRLSDLRPTRWLGYLHYEATVQQRNLVSLAIRLETLMITSNGETLRPPRAVALGLALFLWSLADNLPSAEPADTIAAQGRVVLQSRCGQCHSGVGLTGAPVAADVVGTDPAAALDAGRGRGVYRVPSLRGVGRRATLLHDGSIRGLDDFLDPTRARGPNRAAGGHPFGLDLDPAARASLIAYLRGL